MAELLQAVASLIVLGAAVLAALSALGVVRFHELLPRMHALTKASTGAVSLAVIGTALALRSAATVTTLVLVLALQLFTFPVGANLIARAVRGRAEDTGLRAPDDRDDAPPAPG